tara:strand:+ start:366 stop:1412 length:1047 start_codon:yes stop_codon:yes gene_type:complete
MVDYINISNNLHPNRQFYTTLTNSYLTNTGKEGEKILKVVHNNKHVKAGIHKDTQKMGDPNTYYSDNFIKNPVNFNIIDKDVFLLFDDAGLNYAHFFFDMFGKCIYFDHLKKENPNLKLGIAQEYWTDTGKNNYIKQWLNLYYDNIEVVIFKTNKSYQIKNLILPNCFYWFPETQGHDIIVEKIKETANKIKKIPVKSKGCYISRQDTIKKGWYHKRNLVNENELIDRIKNELEYDIIELMDYDIIGKIQIFKSYKNIIQQNSASNINLIFSGPETKHLILTNPRMGEWMNFKLGQFSNQINTNLLTINNVGKYLTEELDPNELNPDNHPWELTNIDGLMEVFNQINN